MPGVGRGSLADPAPFLEQQAAAGITAAVETEVRGFDFAGFAEAWDVMASVTATQLPPSASKKPAPPPRPPSGPTVTAPATTATPPSSSPGNGSDARPATASGR